MTSPSFVFKRSQRGDWPVTSHAQKNPVISSFYFMYKKFIHAALFPVLEGIWFIEILCAHKMSGTVVNIWMDKKRSLLENFCLGPLWIMIFNSCQVVLLE